MRSPLGTLFDKAPVPYVGRSSIRWPFGGSQRGAEAQLRAMGGVGALFAIVDRLATSTAAVDWHLYRKAKPGQDPKDREEVTAHLALDIWTKPNAFFTQQLLVETFEQHFELVGEGYMVVARDPRATIPLELWPVRPDRIDPVPSPEDYLVGYIYTGPDGEQIPLQLDEVIPIRRPNPIDSYRGIGAVQTILADLEGVKLSAEWNRNFFRNSAEPGGIIEVDKRLSDPEFKEMTERWREQHQGVNNAHRVAVIEQGKWIDRKYTNRDMQFVELRSASSAVIREAFGMPKFAVGDVDDVNRATAEASKAWFAEQMTVPRLERIKQALNSRYLPMFGKAGADLEFDYESPVPGDREADDRERTSKAEAAATLIEAGVYGPEVLATYGLPPMSFGQPDANPDRELLIKLVTGAPTLAPMILPMLGFDVPKEFIPAAPAPATAAPAARLDIHHHPADAARPGDQPTLSLFDLARSRTARPALLKAQDDDSDEESEPGPLAQVRADFEAALEKLLADWQPIMDAQVEDLADQITAAINEEDLEALSALTASTDDAAELLRQALADMANTAAAQMVAEADAQGVKVTAPKVDAALTNLAPGGLVLTNYGVELVGIAAATASLLASALADSAGREALRLFVPGVKGSEVAGKVKGFLKGLSLRGLKDAVGGALHRATNLGRLATLKVAPVATYTATEVNDSNRCEPCRDIDGTVFEDLAAATEAYGAGPYWACDGGIRCRGTVYATWPNGE